MTPEQIASKALSEARELRIDDIVRTIAFSGDVEGPNAERIFDKKRFRATSGAGTNSASVAVLDDSAQFIYQADDYGKCIRVFRNGPWVKRAADQADRILAVKDADQHAADMKQAEELKAKFSPFED